MESSHPLPPTTTKRPRKKSREVSSRYLSTPAPSPFIPSLHTHTLKIRKSSSINSSPESTDPESEVPNDSFVQNQNPNTPFPFNHYNKIPPTQRKTAIKLFGDNVPHLSKKTRPATPFASFSPKGTISSNTLVGNARVNANGKSVKLKNSSDNGSVVSDSEVEDCGVSDNGGFCDSPPINGRCSKNQDGFRSSMPDGDLLPYLSNRRGQNDLNESHGDSAVCRSLNLGHSSNQHNPFQNKNGRYVPSKICLPPQSKMNGELNKGKRGSKQEDIHMLKLLQNKYTQWRFINAKAKEAVDVKTAGAEKSLYGLSVKIAEMKNGIMEKRMEVERLKRMQDLSLVHESQMPCLDRYSNLEKDYHSSLAGIIKALQDCSLRLPTTENVRADVNELEQIFDSTTNIFNSLSPSIGKFMPKTEEVKDVISNLTEVARIERDLVENCGNLLFEVHNMQMTECSLRGQLMQAKKNGV